MPLHCYLPVRRIVLSGSGLARRRWPAVVKQGVRVRIGRAGQGNGQQESCGAPTVRHLCPNGISVCTESVDHVRHSSVPDHSTASLCRVVAPTPRTTCRSLQQPGSYNSDTNRAPAKPHFAQCPHALRFAARCPVPARTHTGTPDPNPTAAGAGAGARAFVAEAAAAATPAAALAALPAPAPGAQHGGGGGSQPVPTPTPLLQTVQGWPHRRAPAAAARRGRDYCAWRVV